MKPFDLIYGDPAMIYDLMTMIIGDEIGRGQSRVVFEHQFDENVVVKIALNKTGVLCNVTEFNAWQDAGKLQRYLAQPTYLSPNGNVLFMKRTKPVDKVPRSFPKLFTDQHVDNFGMLDGKVVMHDYGNQKFFVR